MYRNNKAKRSPETQGREEQHQAQRDWKGETEGSAEQRAKKSPDRVSITSATVESEEEELAAKYQKMLRIGLPADVVRHKMKQEQCSQSVIDRVFPLSLAIVPHSSSTSVSNPTEGSLSLQVLATELGSPPKRLADADSYSHLGGYSPFLFAKKVISWLMGVQSQQKPQTEARDTEAIVCAASKSKGLSEAGKEGCHWKTFGDEKALAVKTDEPSLSKYIQMQKVIIILTVARYAGLSERL